ncbi:hypothetical protein [Paraburkholderia aromaticivorans]|uniref:Uncharacterized protein n=1 Tax=Paraburkholderia aromaticivorans TaxID=2026199 RepID=A0A248VZR2_9BURK|nr:hypothetical protein [Paraburkholderia aromaticivorans]ASW03880.1 hypothetical protein CJU94_37560 [Paraburkholderia aromaticivorans]
MNQVHPQRYRTTTWERARVAHLRGRPDFARHLRGIARPMQISYQRLMQAYNGEPVGVECRERERDAWAFVVPEMSGSGRWRIQRFDLDGFVGHMCFDTLAIAVENMLQEGYRILDAGALDRVAATNRWAKGIKRAAVVQRCQEGLITYAQMLDELRRMQEEATAGS